MASDIFDLTFTFFYVPICGEEDLLACSGNGVFNAINRETGAFAAVFYICMTAGRERWLPLAWRSLLLGFVPYIGAILVRKLNFQRWLVLPKADGVSGNRAILYEDSWVVDEIIQSIKTATCATKRILPW
jgi:hypothetical protein